MQRLKLASEREQEIDTRLQTRKKTQTNKYVGSERELFRLQVHGEVRGYNQIRAGDGALRSDGSGEQGDNREKKVDPLGREHTSVYPLLSSQWHPLCQSKAAPFIAQGAAVTSIKDLL